MILRDYQQQAVADLRAALREVHAALLQLATGTGKTKIVAAIIALMQSLARERGRIVRAWFIVPRKRLLDQAEKHFKVAGIAFARIDAKHKESRAFYVHINSRDTILRRLDKIKNWPEVLFFDEAHIAMDAQRKIIDRANAARALLGLPPVLVIGVSATPEQTDGTGMSTIAGGIYDRLVDGPSIPWFTQAGYLAPLRYYAPPAPEGIADLHYRGTEVIESEYDEYLEKNKQIIYGDCIKYYRKYGHRNIPGARTHWKPALIFAQSVKAAKETAAAFCDAGFDFRPIWGDMPDDERDFAFRAIEEEKIHGLVNCDLATYGVDIPNLEYGASTRLTLSRNLYFQIVGRFLRPFYRTRCRSCGIEVDGAMSECTRCHSRSTYTSYEKPEALFFDHANLIGEHQDPRYPGLPLFFVPDLKWNFDGIEKRKRLPKEQRLVPSCPYNDFLVCNRQTCTGCPHKPDGSGDPRAKKVEVVETELTERKAPTSWTELQPEERREVQDRIAHAADEAVAALALGRIEPGPIGELLAVAAELGRAKMWVYWFLTEKLGAKAVCIPLIHEIGRQCGYKPGWARYKVKELRQGVKEGAV